MVDVDELMNAVTHAGFQVGDAMTLQSLPGSFAEIPPGLEPQLRVILSEKYPKGLFGHQAREIKAGLEGRDICLATSTASGKSLVFITLAAHRLISEKLTRVLAIYPARALILDQQRKWEEVMDPLGIPVGRIDGGVEVGQRASILENTRIVLMTPDVAHAWLMRSLTEDSIAAFMSRLRLLVLDEAHSYEGVFGTNAAYFLRRLQAASQINQIVISTATLKDPKSFANRLTGRDFLCFDHNEETHQVAAKLLFSLRSARPSARTFEPICSLLTGLSQIALKARFRFLAFGDSRKLVEQVVMATQRGLARATGNAPEDDDNVEQEAPSAHPVLPYRAGYEEEDRVAIQRALGNGELAGVVATSALELGIDIGEIDVVVLLGTPRSMKSFWQRMGRAGRRNRGFCLIIDEKDFISSLGGLKPYIERPLEPNWLYLDNHYIQYSHALCAAFEIGEQPIERYGNAIFDTLPSSFRWLLDNELNPKEPIPNDLYEMKQRSLAGPHQEFPLRSAADIEFSVQGSHGRSLGKLTYPQALREAYPGAIYYYMARPNRVFQFNFRDRAIGVRSDRRWTTTPIRRVMVFPRFPDGILHHLASPDAAVVEAEMQVSEQVIGFAEQRGKVKERHLYGPQSSYARRSLNRFFRTTGVCLKFPRSNLQSETIDVFAEAFCTEFGVQERDVGIGEFYSKVNFQGSAEVLRGPCIYDATNGSLRLTHQLAEDFDRAIAAAIELAERREQHLVLDQLLSLKTASSSLRRILSSNKAELPSRNQWIEVICPDNIGIYTALNGEKREVRVLGFRYSPKGALYDI